MHGNLSSLRLCFKMKLFTKASLLHAVAATSVLIPQAVALDGLRGKHRLPQLNNVETACTSNSECVSGYCAKNDSGQQGICVLSRESEANATQPNVRPSLGQVSPNFRRPGSVARLTSTSNHKISAKALSTVDKDIERKLVGGQSDMQRPKPSDQIEVLDPFAANERNMRNLGYSCKKRSYGRGAGNAKNSKCEKKHGRGKCEKNGRRWYPKCREGYYNVGCCICRCRDTNDFISRFTSHVAIRNTVVSTGPLDDE